MIYHFPNFKVVTQHRHLRKNAELISVRIQRFSQHADRTIFSSCHGNDGASLSEEKRKEILSYLNKPTHEKWDRIYRWHIFPNKSLWDAWNKVSNNLVSCVCNLDDVHAKWKTIPTSEDLVIGIGIIRDIELEKLVTMKNKIDKNTLSLEYKFKNYLLKNA